MWCLVLLLLFVLSVNGGLKDYGDVWKEIEKSRRLFKRYVQDEGYSLQNISMTEDWIPDHRQGKGGSVYDFIIVGSGSAGAVVANRLSENPKWKVLLIEAGKRENFLTRFPIIAPVFQLSAYDWQYIMEYDPGFARGMIGKRLAWPRGKALGGTSVINYMIYTRGNPKDFDKWAEGGCPGWSYEDVLPYYMKSEKCSLTYQDSKYHGHSGYWSTENINQTPLADAFVQGGRELGYDFVDYSSPRHLGFSYVQANTKKGRRHSIAAAFLETVKDRKNLDIITSALVTKVLIDPHTRHAQGVHYIRNNKKYKVYADKEVILSAGAIESPHLLMLSGIGPTDQLKEFGIPTLVDLPVGENLHDHITYVGLNFIVDQNVSLSVSGVLNAESIGSFFTKGRGPITSLGGVEGIAYVKTEVSVDPDPNYGDVELIFVSGSLSSDYGIVNRRVMKIRDDVYNKLWAPLHGQPTWTIFPMLLHPRSTGRLQLASADVRRPPKLHGDYLRHADDVRTMVGAIRIVQKLADTPAFRRYGARLHSAPVPGCEHLEFDSDAYWECALRTLSITLHHQVGTCKMGAPHDPTAVVDPQLRVYGISGLRVIDTSVIPRAISAHTNAPSVMVGEKGADMIKEWWGKT